ncbi:MAG: DEAD/DEAH box helicase family protein [Candidatus Delongbacteria bacterium]|nr:DEAD/DEAH box helicase family protein [Candidatus Delongbacteria bacterium]MBN2835882.1 DEAD/DEAH box helicase family protein [Candidatus Delongbacteria bacterium]
MQNKILDNKQLGNVGDVLREGLKPKSKVSIISAYFTIYAYEALRKELSKIDSLRLLFSEPTFLEETKEIKREFSLISKEKNISGDMFEIKLKNELNQTQIAKECAKWIKEKVEIRAYDSIYSLPQKMFHVINNERSILIQGSSNFTSSGLGFVKSNSHEMNIYTEDEYSTNQMLNYFNDNWIDKDKVKDVKQAVLEKLEEVYKENTPEFIYYITLYNLFKDYLEDLNEEKIVKSKTGFKETIVWNKLYKFQKDGVLGSISKLEKYNGCIIADSVGLGKTFEALAVIKYYELRNSRVLVLCPKKLRDNWLMYRENDKRNILANDRFSYDVLNHTDLTRERGLSGSINLETINWGNYDLVVIDESHNFRNNNAREDKETRYSKLINHIIKAGIKTKVLMLSATPVNSKMNDLKNQVAFITEGNDSAFRDDNIKSIELTMRKAQEAFNRWSKLGGEAKTVASLIDMLNLEYFKLLDLITIARSRKHIEKYYDIKDIGKFPERKTPINIKSDIDLQFEYPPLKDVNKDIRKLNLSLYAPLRYVRIDKINDYNRKYDRKVKGGQSVFKQSDREESLIHLIRVNLLKRMESSINSFTKTVKKTIGKIDHLLKKIETQDDTFIQDLEIDDIDFDDSRFEDLIIGNKIKILLHDMDLTRWKQDLLEDRARLENLFNDANNITPKRDAKLEQLKKEISKKVNSPINDDNKKIVIFTAFADTAKYLYDNISDWAKSNLNLESALVTGSGENKTTNKIFRNDLNSILINFSPISKERNLLFPEITKEIDILIATDCISEGQNLQDGDYLINYDIHWNPVRIIQRFGRIDRLGSKNSCSQLVNFWPNLELDEYINLESRVSGRMVLLDISATGEENVIEEDSSMKDLDYRKKQLEQLQKSVLDLEDIKGGISLTDLTFNDFKMDLMEYLKTNQSYLNKAPMGMYAVAKSEIEEAKSGVIFCLKQVDENRLDISKNAFSPYFMIYINEEGEVYHSFVHSKKILDIYKKLCDKKDVVQEESVSLFNQETNECSDMSYYTYLLEEAVKNIIGKEEEKGVESLFSRGGTTLDVDRFKGLEDFELISFLVIK